MRRPKLQAQTRADWLEDAGTNLGMTDGEEHVADRPRDMDLIREGATCHSSRPEGSDANSRILRQLKTTRRMIDGAQGVELGHRRGACVRDADFCEVPPVPPLGRGVGRGTVLSAHAPSSIDQKQRGQVLPAVQYPLWSGSARGHPTSRAVQSLGVLGL